MKNRPRSLPCAVLFLCSAVAGIAGGTPPATSAERPNILLITADDLNQDSVGVYGSRTPGTTPNIDLLAASGLRFEHAHVTIAVCQPCRSVWMTGRYPHRSGGEGFHRLCIQGVPILPALLREAGYRVGILGKVGHSTPYADFRWDAEHKAAQLGGGRAPALYRERALAFFRSGAGEARRPFFLMANSHDPHRPFEGASRRVDGASAPSRRFRPEEVAVPRFLPDVSPVRREIAEYLSSVRRCDDTLGALLGALEESEAADRTLVIFLSDHGMAFPFAKTNCYLHSTRIPWIVRWPGHVTAGVVDREHMVSGIDLFPTILEAAGIAAPEGVDGRSLLPLLRGEGQEGRDRVFTQFHATSARRAYPMRAVITKRYCYIYNPWSDGVRTFRNESQAGRTMKAMVAAAESDPSIRARVELFLHRVPEELYVIDEDPDALWNRIDEARFQKELEELRGALLTWMETTNDPALDAFRSREDDSLRRKFVEEDEARARSRRR